MTNASPHRPPTRWRWLAAAAWALALVLALGDAHAQTIDEVSVKAQGDDMVARVEFRGTVRFLQQAPATPARLYRIGFDLIAADESVVNQVTEESKRVAAVGAMPEFTLTYTPAPGRRSKQLTLQLSASSVVKVRQGPSSSAIDIVFLGLASQKSLLPSAERNFAITTQSVPVSEIDKLLPVPVTFQAFEVFSTNTVVNGVPYVEVNIGYFATKEEAETVRRAVLERFPQATVLDLVERRDALLHPTAVLPPLAAAAPAVAASAPPVAAPAVVVAAAPTPVLPDVETQAADLMARARAAFAAGKYEDAIQALNQLLRLPPNKFSQEAQELIGLAWERAGDTRRAQAEYELYLKLYPGGEGAERVGQRLAALGGGAAGGSKTLAGAAAATPEKDRRFSGNIAQYYYGGKARSQSLVNVAAGIDQSTLTKTTESAIVTSVDLSGKYASADADTRVVVRGTNSANLMADSHSASLLNAAFVDYKRKEGGLAVRVGRQSALNGGLLGLFDGVSMTYPVKEGMRVNLMGGVPANPLVSAPSERLLAGMFEADTLWDHWGGNLYVLNQTTEGITNRRAIGGEARYSDERFSMYSLLDYDVLFRKLNAITVQGSFQAPAQTTVTVLADSRKAPSLQMTNALISSGAASLKTLLQTQTLDEVRAQAQDTTAEAKQFLISVSRPLNEKWQIAGDLRYSAIGALPQVGTNFEATPATGGQYGVSLQLTGSNLYSPRDINNFNLSLLSTPTLKGTQISYNNLTALRDNDVTVEPSIRYYTQHGNDGTLSRIAPGLRGSYRLSRRASLLGETVYERSRLESASNHDTTNSVFFYVGYRYELF